MFLGDKKVIMILIVHGGLSIAAKKRLKTSRRHHSLAYRLSHVLRFYCWRSWEDGWLQEIFGSITAPFTWFVHFASRGLLRLWKSIVRSRSCFVSCRKNNSCKRLKRYDRDKKWPLRDKYNVIKISFHRIIILILIRTTLTTVGHNVLFDLPEIKSILSFFKVLRPDHGPHDTHFLSGASWNHFG